MTRSEYFGDWLKVLEGKEMDQTLSAISDKYGRSGGCCPLYTSIFKAFHVCDYNNLKSVWVGMDPYPERRYATGILFGNPPEVVENIGCCIQRNWGSHQGQFTGEYSKTGGTDD